MKVSLLASVIAALAMNGGTMLNANVSKLPEKDTSIIVELSRGLDGLTEEGVISTQNAIVNKIRNEVTRNCNIIDRFTVLNNAVALQVNSEDVEAIKNVAGVESVTINKIHWTRALNNDEVISVTPKGTEVEENISATTMHKPTDTNDGEGTVIAILDNEFWLKGNSADGVNDEWHHEVFDALDADVAQRFTFESVSKTKFLKAKRNSKVGAGTEGSLYFNSKVPFYYDYGGDSTTYGKTGPADYDVHTATSYHGSHVASIAAANAPTYKGIAPKAQLVCMKVFTEYTADQLGKDLGFGNSTGAYDLPILNALEDCIKLGVDGINMSLGSDLDDFDGESITLKTLTKLAQSGIMTSISAGNAGKSAYSFTGGYGNWTKDVVETGILGSYANNEAATIVASGQPTKVYYKNALNISGHNVAYEDQIVNREGLDDEYSVEYKLADLGSGDVEYVYVPGFGAASDYEGLDVNGKVAVVNRGSISFATKYNTAKNKRAIGVVIINNDPTASDFNFRCSFGDDFNPTIPCALVLYKDKPFFEANQNGSFKLISDKVADNDNAYTISTFSSDGAKYNLDMKPEITAPGDIIRGAVPPQKKEDKQNTPYSTYEYLSGTSMSAPNNAGAQSVVLSKVAKDVYSKAEPTKDEINSVAEYRKTVDMRIASTADPMYDSEVNPENGELTLTSPRLQGAGMVNIGDALNTSVYLEGYQFGTKQGSGKTKIQLRNNDDIANGRVNLSFLAHNESEETKQYDVKVTIMRPAVVSNNKVISKEYTYIGEVDSMDRISGITYWEWYTDYKGGEFVTEAKQYNNGAAVAKQVMKVSKQIEYYKSEADLKNNNKSIFTIGYWTYNGTEWVELPDYEYQSVQDIVVATVTGQTVSIAPGQSEVKLNDYTLSNEVKDELLELFEYGSYIEGFVTLTAKNAADTDLNIPFLGFYSGTDKDSTRSYASAPVAEPFNFEKSSSEIYASDLANDLAKQLVGKDNADMGSMMVAGYAEEPQAINKEKVLSNDLNFSMLNGFHNVGTDPRTGSYFDNAANNIYIGNPETTNTLIVQQFILRSVVDNYFTIKNVNTGEIAYKSVLEDMLFGEQGGKYPLYKSHVDSSYLGAGYVAHRACAIIPLFDEQTREAFAEGEYEIEFNYLLAGTGTWVKKAYNLYIDSTAPEFTGVETYMADNGDDMVRFNFKDHKINNASIGSKYYDVKFDEAKQVYYIEDTVEAIDAISEKIGISSSNQARVYVQAQDNAYGKTGVIMHFAKEGDYSSKCISVQGPTLRLNNDFIINEAEKTIRFIEIATDDSERDIDVAKYTLNGIDLNPVVPAAKGCAGSAATSCLVLTAIASISLVALFVLRRKKKIGGTR